MRAFPFLFVTLSHRLLLNIASRSGFNVIKQVTM